MYRSTKAWCRPMAGPLSTTTSPSAPWRRRSRRWELPQKKDVQELDKESQFAAWVLVNGYDVNHFTASINSHGVESLADIEQTVAAMRGAGIPMKQEIEGAPGTKLRQSSTEAAVI